MAITCLEYVQNVMIGSLAENALELRTLYLGLDTLTMAVALAFESLVLQAGRVDAVATIRRAAPDRRAVGASVA
jgi:hypothetical protein